MNSQWAERIFAVIDAEQVCQMALVIEAFEKWAADYEARAIYRFAGGEVHPKASIGAIAGGELHNMVRLRDSTSVDDLLCATKIYALSALRICGAA